MMLVHQDFEEPIEFKEGKANMLIVEKQDKFLEYISDLCNQIKGDSGFFVLSEKNCQIDISKAMDIIFSPLIVDINNRISISSLHKELSSRAFDENYCEKINKTCELVENIVKELIMDSDVEIDYDELSVSSLFKSMNVKFHSSEDIIERICDYISVKSIYEKKKVVIIINGCSYFNNEQMQLILNHVFNLKIHVILFEQHLSYKPLNVEIKTIDADLCEY